MSTETKIGIVTGLLIVVVASVYFSRRNGGQEAEFLISAGSGGPTPPKIPVAKDLPDAGVVTRKNTGGTSVPRAMRPPAVVKADGERWKPPAALTWLPGDNRGAGAGGERVARSDGRPGLASGPLPRRPSTTALRTAPARSLVEATRENINKAGHASSLASGSYPTEKRQNAKTAKRQRDYPDLSPQHSVLSTQQTTGGTQVPQRATRSLWPREHKISSGDTLSAIAGRYYGDSRMFTSILRANPQITDARGLKIGEIITIPRPEMSPTTSRGGSGARVSSGSASSYTVQAGDTFYSIAQALYGSAARWREIYESNKGLVKNDPKKLRPGMVIRLP